MSERKVTDLTVDELIALLAAHAQLSRVEHRGGFDNDPKSVRIGFENVMRIALMKMKAPLS